MLKIDACCGHVKLKIYITIHRTSTYLLCKQSEHSWSDKLGMLQSETVLTNVSGFYRVMLRRGPIKSRDPVGHCLLVSDPCSLTHTHKVAPQSYSQTSVWQ